MFRNPDLARRNQALDAIQKAAHDLILLQKLISSNRGSSQTCLKAGLLRTSSNCSVAGQALLDYSSTFFHTFTLATTRSDYKVAIRLKAGIIAFFARGPLSRDMERRKS
jgi:hypothetical protein